MELHLRVRRACMVDGMSTREASRVFGLHRDTVRKMLAYSVPPGYRRRQDAQDPIATDRSGTVGHSLLYSTCDGEPKSFADHIGRKRRRLGMSRREISEQFGLVERNVRTWEDGAPLPNEETYLRLLDITRPRPRVIAAGTNQTIPHSAWADIYGTEEKYWQ